MRVPDQSGVRQVRDGFRCASIGYLASAHKTTKRVQSLGLHELGSVEWLLLAAGELLIKCVDRLAAPKEEIRQRGRVHDDQRLSRSSRITVALDGPS